MKKLTYIVRWTDENNKKHSKYYIDYKVAQNAVKYVEPKNPPEE